MALDEDVSMGRNHKDPRIVDLLDPVTSRCTVVTQEGQRIRISAQLVVIGRLSRQCFAALGQSLPAADFFLFKRELLAQLNYLSLSQRRSRTAIWRVFSATVLGIFGLPHSTETHASKQSLPRNPATLSDPITRRLAIAVRTRFPSQDPKSSKPTWQPAFGEKLEPSATGAVLLALHLVAQDCRLSSTRQEDLSMLATLLIELAGRMGRMDWQDYWIRVMPTSVGPDSFPLGTESTYIDLTLQLL